jgi:O-succinylbenzoic acid--CoA ligase
MLPLILNGKAIAIEQILETEAHLIKPDLTDYELQVLRFCRQWLSGQSQFQLHTSGSTGQPKVISLKRDQMVASAHLTGRALGLTTGDRALVCLSAEYIAGLMMLVRGFELGLRLTIISPSSNPLADFSPETDFDFTAVVPLQLQAILTTSPEKIAILDRMKAILVGGAPVSLALQQQLQVITAPVYHTYGMTETVSHIALRRLNGPTASERFIPFGGVELALDERGCLTIKATVTGGEQLQTNDLVDLQPDGSFIWLGRVDHVINSGGVKVQLEKVERALEAFLTDYEDGCYAHRRFFVGSLPNERLGQAVVAVIEGEPISTNMPATSFETIARTALKQALNQYEIPRQICFLKSFTETPTGKIDRPANLKRL